MKRFIDQDSVGGIAPLTTEQVADSFSKRDRKKLWIPNLSSINWNEIDYLSWQHRDGSVWYVVYNLMGENHGIIMERTDPANYINKQCGWCATVNSGANVALFTTRHATEKNRVVGQYVCGRLDCSDYIRGKKEPSVAHYASYLDLRTRVQNLRTHLDEFFFQVLF